MKIEKCPFCGGEQAIKVCYIGYGSLGLGGHDEYRVVCKECRTSSDEYKSEAKAIAAWNRRVDARQLALKTRVCPMCEDCPDGCPVETPKDSRNIVTNADRIRSMSDDEMANWLDSLFNERRDDWKPIGCYNCINYGTHHSDPANKGTRLYECDGCDFEGSQENGYKYGILNWLKQPVKEET